jgi:YD repeat-containing protein
VTYSYSGGRLASVTARDNSVWSFVYADATSTSGPTMSFVKPGASTPWLTNTLGTAYDELGYSYDIVSGQAFADGHTYSYSPKSTPFVTDRPSSIAGGVIRDNLGNQTRVIYGFPIMPGTGGGGTCSPPPCSPQQIGTQHYQQTSGPQTITDPLLRVTTMDYCDPAVYCAVTLLQSYTDPEGIKVAFTYDNWRNVTKAVRSAKPGGGLPDQVTTATYDCTYPISCAKPTSVTDPKGYTTNYTYDPVHGGILTESDPPDASGIRPAKRSAYVQRYAWVSNGTGGYVHAAAPIWLLATEKTCRSTATVGDSCAGGANDEIVMTYDYGPDSGPNTLLLRGTAVTAVTPNAAGTLVSTTLRSCYGYDAQGNKISETKPRANLAVCP